MELLYEKKKKKKKKNDPRKFGASQCTTLRLVPKINISFTYNSMITHSFPIHFVYTHLSTSIDKNPFSNKALSNFSYHYLGACFKPYRDLFNLQTLFSCPSVIQPLGCNM